MTSSKTATWSLENLSASSRNRSVTRRSIDVYRVSDARLSAVSSSVINDRASDVMFDLPRPKFYFRIAGQWRNLAKTITRKSAKET
jgi:hypothetical protein